MLRSALYRRSARVLAIAALLLALTAGGAFATDILGPVVGSDGVIHGCYQKSNGTLRVVAAADGTCRNSEQPIAWSQTGPKGDRGDTGDKGDPGAGDDPQRLGRDGQRHPVRRLPADDRLTRPQPATGRTRESGRTGAPADRRRGSRA